MNWLQQILTNKRAEIDQRLRETPLAEMRRLGSASPSSPSLQAALRASPMGLIAELKRRSPSAGAIRDPFDPVVLARQYARGGAQGLSVLMDERFFGGGESDFRAVRACVERPLLYKEFVVDTWQIWHAAHVRASAVLLIVAALSDGALRELLAECEAARLEALVEVHDEAEAGRALAAGAAFLGVNNRDLRTFQVSLDTTARVARSLPAGVLLVSESGIRSAADVAAVRAAGAGAVLVGEHLLRQPDVGAAVKGLMGQVWASS